MRLLLDANLSWRMIAILKPHFDDCFHVNSIGLPMPPKDAEIWKYARKEGLIIVTNDEDFIDLVNVWGFPPKVILLKTGNQNRLVLSNLMIQRKDEIRQLEDSTELGVLEIVAK